MGNIVVTGASWSCTGGCTGTFVATTTPKIRVGQGVCGNVADNTASNLIPAGMCTQDANPLVAAATAANLGVKTPGGCIPSPTGQWQTESNAQSQGKVLTIPCSLKCTYGGTISINAPGQATVQA